MSRPTDPTSLRAASGSTTMTGTPETLTGGDNSSIATYAFNANRERGSRDDPGAPTNRSTTMTPTAPRLTASATLVPTDKPSTKPRGPVSTPMNRTSNTTLP